MDRKNAVKITTQELAECEGELEAIRAARLTILDSQRQQKLALYSSLVGNFRRIKADTPTEPGK